MWMFPRNVLFPPALILVPEGSTRWSSLAPGTFPVCLLVLGVPSIKLLVPAFTGVPLLNPNYHVSSPTEPPLAFSTGPYPLVLLIPVHMSFFGRSSFVLSHTRRLPTLVSCLLSRPSPVILLRDLSRSLGPPLSIGFFVPRRCREAAPSLREVASSSPFSLAILPSSLLGIALNLCGYTPVDK